jgi:hypothetical protein
MNSWSEHIITEIHQRLEGTREKDMRFFRIEELERNIVRADQFSPSCRDCQNLKKDIESGMLHINEAVNVPGQYRRQLDRLIAQLARHMMKSHNFYPPWHFNYLYSFYGIAAGSLTGLAAVWLTPGRPWEIMAAGFVGGLIAGQFTGGRKDRTIREENRLM